jgi:hypothetical protein
MLSRDNLEYARQLVEANRDDYPYYVIVTNTNISDNYDYQSPSFKVYLSKSKINANGRYTFTIPNNSYCYSVISSNASRQYHSERVSVSNYSGILSVPTYEFCYTNAEFSGNTVQPDVLADNNVTQSHFDGVSLIMLAVLLSSVVFKIVRG